jgi:hypothetical protein
MNRKKRRLVLATLTILITASFSLSCGGKKLRQEERWEGLEGSRLRVLARHDFSGDAVEGDEEKLIHDTLLLEGKKRAINILVSHLRLKYPELRDSRPVERKIIECLEKGVIFHSDCGDTECVAIIDFDMEPVMKLLEGRVQ